jgi:hypothetical protein
MRVAATGRIDMNGKRAVLVAALALAACHGSPTRPISRTEEPPVSAAPSRIASTRISSPVPLQLAGTYVHPGSGIAFPDKSAGFTRVAPNRYDREGNDVGIGYRRFWTDDALLYRAELTVFVFPSLRGADGSEIPFDQQFEQEVQEVATFKEYADVREVRRVNADASGTSERRNSRSAEDRSSAGYR